MNVSHWLLQVACWNEQCLDDFSVVKHFMVSDLEKNFFPAFAVYGLQSSERWFIVWNDCRQEPPFTDFVFVSV